MLKSNTIWIISPKCSEIFNKISFSRHTSSQKNVTAFPESSFNSPLAEGTNQVHAFEAGRNLAKFDKN